MQRRTKIFYIMSIANNEKRVSRSRFSLNLNKDSIIKINLAEISIIKKTVFFAISFGQLIQLSGFRLIILRLP